MGNRIPDFTMMNWKLVSLNQDLLAYDKKDCGKSFKIGFQDFYINQETGEMGVNVISLKTAPLIICKIWEKKLIYDNAEVKLHYIGIYSGQWERYRIKDPLVTAEIVKDDFGRILGAEVIFTLATEQRKSFFLPIQLINAQ